MMLKVSTVKIYTLCVLVIILCSVFSACTNLKSEEILYVYGIGIEKTENTPVKLYVLTKTDKQETTDSGSSKSNGKTGGNQSGAEQDPKSTGEIMSLEGESIEKVFDTLFEGQKLLYTGTNKIYVVTTDSEDFLYEFKVYLTNSSKLPVKVETVQAESAYEYLKKNTNLAQK